MKVRFAPRARRDLEAILEHLSEHNPQGARNVGRALRATIALIEQFPESGRFAGESAVRVLPAGRYPYLVYWVIEAGEALIVHIRDGRQKPWR